MPFSPRHPTRHKQTVAAFLHPIRFTTSSTIPSSTTPPPWKRNRLQNTPPPNPIHHRNIFRNVPKRPRHPLTHPQTRPTQPLKTVALIDTDDKNALPPSHTLTADQLFRDDHRFIDMTIPDESSLHLARRRRLNAIVALFAGVICLPVFGHLLAELVVPRNTPHVQTLITGAFMPLVGILFAMLSSTAVVALRQRQQDLRDLLHQELSLIRMLLVMIKDENIIKLLLKYTLELESETFSHKKNAISYDYEVPGTREAIRREEVFAESEETLWKCFEMANELRLRPEVEGVIRNLVTFRTKRRAVLDSGLPQIHFVITTILGMSMLFGFGLLVANDIALIDMIATRLLFGVLLALLTLTYALIRDLRDPFGGDYGVTPWRLYHTVELLDERLNKAPDTGSLNRDIGTESGMLQRD